MNFWHKLLLTAAVAISPALAAELPEQTSAHGIRYVSGGVGEAEAAAMRAAASRYSLDLLTVAADGSYLSDVQVNIRQRGGEEVLATKTSGPMLLAALPPGRYILEASIRGDVLKQPFSVAKGKPSRVVLRWPHPAAH